jgi:hypothetical protein
MNKEFVPYEQALALKELGFDEPCFGYYHICNTDELKEIYECDYFFHEKSGNFNSNCLLLKAPLYQQAFRWFRYKYNLIGLVEGGYDNGKNIFTYVIWNDFKDSIVDDYYQTYEEAEHECLNKLIEIVK